MFVVLYQEHYTMQTLKRQLSSGFRPRRSSVEIIIKEMFGFGRNAFELTRYDGNIDVSFVERSSYESSIIEETPMEIKSETMGMYNTYYLTMVLDYLKAKNKKYSLLGHPNKPYQDACIYHINDNISLEIRTDPNTSCFAETRIVLNKSNGVVRGKAICHKTSAELFDYLTHQVCVVDEI